MKPEFSEEIKELKLARDESNNFGKSQSSRCVFLMVRGHTLTSLQNEKTDTSEEVKRTFKDGHCACMTRTIDSPRDIDKKK